LEHVRFAVRTTSFFRILLSHVATMVTALIALTHGKECITIVHIADAAFNKLSIYTTTLMK